MGLYIQNMEMPKEGQMLIIFPDGTAYVCFNGMRERLALAEAASVQPHGRLIDASKLHDKCYQHYEDYMNGKSDGKKAILNIEKEMMDAPTIIPAEEGET